MRFDELARFVRKLGAYDAANLDGGGSATLVHRQANGDTHVVNSTIHQRIPGRERPVANHLGIRVGTESESTLESDAR